MQNITTYFKAVVLLILLLPQIASAQTPKMVEVPYEWVQKIKVHLEKIEKNRWGVSAPGELYHLHLILKERSNDPTHFNSLDDLSQNSAMVLYHSDEQLRRYLGLEGDLPIERRTPRSIVGYWDGNIVPAASLMANPSKTLHYISSGTIHSDELAAEMPKKLAFRRDWNVIISPQTYCNVNLIVDISVSFPPAKYNMTLGDRQFNLTMDCKQENKPTKPLPSTN